jgi:hypothetical protein
LEDRASSCASRARDAGLESSSLESCRTSQRAHKATRTSCAEEVVVHYWPWPVGPGCRLGGQGRHRRIRSPKRQLGDSSLKSDKDVAASPQDGAHVSYQVDPSGSLPLWISFDIFGYNWISLDMLGYHWISSEILDIFLKHIQSLPEKYIHLRYPKISIYIQ